MTFEKPYELGLLLKKSDKLWIDANPNFTIPEYFFYNTTNCTDFDSCKAERGRTGN